MGQIRKAKGVSRRKHTVPLRRHMKVVVTYMLLIAIIFSNMSNPLMNVFAGQKKEEFRIHADELQRAAEEALEEGSVVEEPLDIYTKDSSLQKEYDELFAADGTLYEIFPDYERENDLDEMDLRVFLRLSPEADPKSYVLTGEETFIFLYVNGGDETAAGRINIDGYISGICSLKSYGAVFDKEDKGNGGGHHSSITINSETEAPTDPAENADVTEEETKAAEDKKNENADNSGEKTSQDSEKKDDAGKDTVDEDKSHDNSSDSKSDTADTGNTSDTENKDDNADNSDHDSSENEAGNDNGNENGNGGSDTSDTDTSDNGSDTEDSADTGNGDASDNDSSDSADAGDSDQEDTADSADTVASISLHPRYLLTEVLADEDGSFVEIEESETEIEAETEKETEAETEPEKETKTEAETTVPETEKETLPEETKPSETKPEESLPQETKEETQPAKENEVDSTTETGAAAPEETKTADDTKLSDVPDAANKAEEESEPSFDRVGPLKGETYNLASLDQTVTIRAFTAKLSDMGYDKEELESQGHIIDYMIDPTGSAELVKAPKLARDGAEVTFGVIPQTGYRLMEVTANGVELEEVEAEDIASPSNASRADEAVYYVIPEVLEDQEVEIFLEEEIPGSHPAFKYAETLNGVTVSISAAEGILPEGTTAKIAEVTENVENAVKEKVESEAAETDAVEVKSVLAYDITLYDAQGNVLNDSWSRNGYVKVSFSGAPIEEKSKEAAVIEISHLDTDADTTEGVVTADEIKGLEQVADEVVVADEASVESVEFEAKHFSTYTVTFKYTSIWGNGSNSLQIDVVDTDGNSIITKNVTQTFDNIDQTGSVIVKDLAEKILTDYQLSNEYFFKEAQTINGRSFDTINYEANWNWNNRNYDVVIKVNSTNTLETVSKVKFIFDKIKYVDASITVSGDGTVEAFVGNVSKGIATSEQKLEGIKLIENGYTLKFSPGTGQAVAAIYINNQSLPLNSIKNNSCEITGITGAQDIRVVFSQISKPNNMNWKRSDSSIHNTSTSQTDTTHVLKGNKQLSFTWSDLNKLTLNNTEKVWDNGEFFPTYKGATEVEPYATWRYLSGNGNYELRRFQTTFTIPEGCSTADYVRLKSIHADKYGDYNDGNIIPINDDIFIFIYNVKDKNKITDAAGAYNYMKYLAFWTGTISQDNNATFHGVEGTTPYQDKVNTPFKKYTDGWYCEADLDNVGSMLFKNYPDGKAGDEFVLDVFVGDYSTGGGMDPLELEFVKTTGSPVTIRYYKDQITTPDDNTHFLGAETIKGLMLGQEIDLSSYGDGSYLNKYKPNTGNYLDGAQSPLPYIVKEEAGVINVLYVTQKQPVRVEYYTRDNESIQEGNWTPLGELPEQQFPLGWKYEDAVNKEYGKNTWLTEAERDWYDDGFVHEGTNEITENTDVIKVVYTKKHGDFQITKVLQGNTQSNAISNVQFQLYKSDASWSTSELYGNPVNAVQNVDVTTGTVDFTKIPGGYYILKETQTAPGYNALTFGIRLQITLDDDKNVVCKFYDSEGTEIIQDGKYYGNAVEMKEGKMIIYNKAGVILPDTGGQGLDGINRIGWSVILTSVIFAGFQLSQTIKRKREE